MSYAKLLKDPRWQKKRLEILERDEWTCQMCEDTEATLTVHHKSYRMEGKKFADIWDYPGEDLITLCEECHSEEESQLKTWQSSLYFSIRSRAESSEAIDQLNYFVGAFADKLGRRLKVEDLVALHYSYIVNGDL